MSEDVDYALLAQLTGIPIIDYKQSVVRVGDIANTRIQERVAVESYEFSMVQTLPIVTAVADDLLRAGAYPLATVSFQANRMANKLQVGDYFKFSYSRYNIVDMVLAVVSIDEGNLTSERITINAKEAIEYLSNSVVLTEDTLGNTGSTEPSSDGTSLSVLDYVKITEAPYMIAGDSIAVYPIASREPSNLTLGYHVYMSSDSGLSYTLVETINSFSPHGVLVDDYPMDTYQVDDYVGFSVDTSDVDMADINNITRDKLFGNTNLAVLGDEIISFQTITPDEAIEGRYHIESIVRGRMDTVPVDHAQGTHFYYLGNSGDLTFTAADIVVGAELMFKFVPFSTLAGDLSEAVPLSITIEGRAKKPYPPLNLMVDDALYNATYSADIILNWDPRVRGEGAGYGLADTVTDAAPVWEGLFEVEVWVEDVLVNTYSEIDAVTWTYSTTMNTADNGALADEIMFKLSNYRFADGYKYSSDQVTISVTKE